MRNEKNVMTSLLLSKDTVWSALSEVYDPELGINVVDLGLVYGVDIKDGAVRVTMTLTTPGCPLHDSLTEAVSEAVRVFVPTVERVEVNLVWEPRWITGNDHRSRAPRAWLVRLGVPQ